MKQKYSVINRLEMMGYNVQITNGGILVYFKTVEFEFVKLVKNEELETKFIIEELVLHFNKYIKEIYKHEKV